MQQFGTKTYRDEGVGVWVGGGTSMLGIDCLVDKRFLVNKHQLLDKHFSVDKYLGRGHSVVGLRLIEGKKVPGPTFCLVL